MSHAWRQRQLVDACRAPGQRSLDRRCPRLVFVHVHEEVIALKPAIGPRHTRQQAAPLGEDAHRNASVRHKGSHQSRRASITISGNLTLLMSHVSAKSDSGESGDSRHGERRSGDCLTSSQRDGAEEEAKGRNRRGGETEAATKETGGQSVHAAGDWNKTHTTARMRIAAQSNHEAQSEEGPNSVTEAATADVPFTLHSSRRSDPSFVDGIGCSPQVSENQQLLVASSPRRCCCCWLSA